MSGNILGKLILSVVVLFWAVMNLLPISDTPFEEFIKSRATAKEAEFSKILEHADELVESDAAPSIFVALSRLGEKERIDFATFFPDVNLADVKNLDQRNDILLKHLFNESRGKIKLGLDLKGGVTFTLRIDDSALAGKEKFQKAQQLSKAIDIMGRRVNGLGVAEPMIRARGADQVEIQLPGITTQENPDALDSLKKPAKLTFHRVHRTLYPETTPEGKEPLGYITMTLEDEDSRTGEIRLRKYFVKKVPEMGGSMVKGAAVTTNQYGGYEISLNMTDVGAKRFEEITASIADENKQNANLPETHPGKYGLLAIVLDGKLYSAPRVNEAIAGGRARIHGQFTQREALELANVLNNPLEFELKLEEMSEIGPTLADDARTASINAALLGAGMVVVFMLVYYLAAGLVAVVAVAMNVVIVLGVLASIQSTLTLPGIAALVLTIGMAVDANILIFERIREELKEGKDLKTSLLAGYEKAFSTIVDANITTLLTAVILIWLGTGPVKGFGVTLAIGIGATMFCALIVSRALLELMVNKRVLKKMLTYSLFKEGHFDYLKFRRPAFIVSWLIVIAGFIAVGVKQDRIYGIDFLGGDEVSIRFSEKLAIQDIDDVVSEADLGEVVPVYQSLIGGKEEQEVLKLQTEQGQGRRVFAELKDAFPEANLEVIGESTIGAAVSGSIKYNALLAIGMALIGILLYVAFRFEFGYGMGAVVSTIHDVLMTIGIYVMLGGQFTAPMVAAILMIVGYSINDTIVVFDRIREELILNPTLSLKKVINIAINKTLSRTLLTSITTLMAAVALYVFGAGVINDFALVFIIGIVTGTFSSIFVASPVFYWWHKGDRKHVEQRDLTPKYEWDASSKISR